MTARRRLAVAIALPVVVTLAFWLLLPASYSENESSDFANFYRPVALELASGHGLGLPDGTPAVRYPPGYPLLLAAVLTVARALHAPEPVALRGLTLVCVAATGLLLLLIAQRRWSGWWAVLPVAAWAVYPPALWLTKQPNSELPFTVLLVGAVLALATLLERKPPEMGLATTAGVLIGVAMLIRPIAIGLALVLGVALWWLLHAWQPRARLIAIGALIGASVVVVLPWQLWLWHHTARRDLLSTGGVPSMRDGLTFAANDAKGRERRWVPEPAQRVMEDLRAQYPAMTSYGGVARVVAAELSARPLGVVELGLLKLARAWYGTDSERFETTLLIVQLGYLALVVVATWRAWTQGAVQRRLTVLIWLIVAYAWAMSALALPLARYLTPALALPLLLLPALARPPRALP